MKQKCQGCRALINKPYWFECGLGYKIKNIEIYIPDLKVSTIKPVPESHCPKPTTYKQWQKSTNINNSIKGA